MKAQEGGLVAGVAIAALGAALALLVQAQPQHLRAPAWVAHTVALAFVFAGWIVVARARGHRRLKAWLPVFLLACLAAPPAWIAFGGGGYRQCGLTLVRGMVRILAVRPDLPCRMAFGFAAAVGLVLLLLSIRQAVHASRAPAP